MRTPSVLRGGAFGFLLCLCAGLTDAAPRRAALVPPPEGAIPEQDIQLVLARATFAAGEPIAVTVRIRNRTAVPLELDNTWPWFQLRGGDVRFRFRSASGELAAIPPGCDDGDGRNMFLTLPPGGKHETVVYLQRYVVPPGPGDHDLSYKAELPAYCPDPTDPGYPNQGAWVWLPGKGRLRFKVRPARPGELEQVAARYAAQLGTPGSTAEEALRVMDHPAVIPHLPRLIRCCHNEGETRRMIRRFAENEQARAVLRRALAAAEESVVVGFLVVLTDWRCDVDVALLRKLFRSDNGHLRWQVQEYARKLGKPEYAEFLKAPDDGPA